MLVCRITSFQFTVMSIPTKGWSDSGALKLGEMMTFDKRGKVWTIESIEIIR